MLMMLCTRFHHFGSAIALPDASLSVFFLAGLWFANQKIIALLMLEAAVIDYVAITHMGVSSYCVSPAYVFLIPTYAALWFAGRTARRWQNLNISNTFKQLGILLAATLLAFSISNGSFYLLSGKFGELSWAEYTGRVMKYLPPYVTSTVLYSTVIITLSKLFSLLLSTELASRRTL